MSISTLLNQPQHCDAFDLLKQIPDNSVDLIFTDPPYWTLNQWRNVGTTTRLGGHQVADKRTGWFETINSTELLELMCELHRVLKTNRHCCIMCDGQTLKWVLGYYEEAGFSYAKPTVWDKVHQGMGYHLRSRHEFVVLMDKGKNRKPNNLSTPDIVAIPYVKNGYPTEKPVALARHYIDLFAQADEIVVDPYCGSGSTALAALEAGCNYIVGDKSPEAVELTNRRIKAQLAEVGLFAELLQKGSD